MVTLSNGDSTAIDRGWRRQHCAKGRESPSGGGAAEAGAPSSAKLQVMLEAPTPPSLHTCKGLSMT